jgi:hypothetical protein
MTYDTNWLNINRGIESNYNPYAKNPYSSAYGPDQFIKSTWLNLAKKYRPDLAKLPESQLLSMRSDPKLSEEFVGYNNKENENYLTSKGAKWDNTNASLAHRFGPSMTMRLLSANPATPIDQLVDPLVLQQNPDLKGRTVNDVITGYQDKMERPNTADKGDMGVPPMQQAMATPQDAKSLLGVSGNPMQLAMQAPEAQEASAAGGLSSLIPKGRDGWKKALLGVGAGLSSIDNPQGAAIALGMMRDMNDEWDLISNKYGTYKYNKRTGELKAVAGAGGPNSSAYDEDTPWGRNMAKKAVERLDENQNAIGDINTRIQKLGELEGYTKDPNVYQGFAGGAVAALKNAARTFGFDEEALGTDETQAFRALSNQFSLSIRNPKAGEGLPGNLSDKDLAFLKESAPSLDNTPEANRKIIGFMRKIEEKNKLMKTEEARFVKEHRTIEGLAEHMEEFRNKVDVFADEAKATEDSKTTIIDYTDL